MGDCNRCEECECGLDTANEFKVPAFVCETILNERLRGRRVHYTYTISDPSKVWFLCRDCCVSTFLGLEPAWTPVDPEKYGPVGT